MHFAFIHSIRLMCFELKSKNNKKGEQNKRNQKYFTMRMPSNLTKCIVRHTKKRKKLKKELYLECRQHHSYFYAFNKSFHRHTTNTCA